MPGKAKGYKHILVIRLSAMGDVAMTVPVIRALMQQHAHLRVTVVSRGQYRPFFEGIPHVSFFEADLKKRHKGLFGLFTLYKDLKALHINAVADLHNVLRTKVLTRLFSLRGKTVATVDKMRVERAQLTALKTKVIAPMPPMVQRHAHVFAQLGYPVTIANPIFAEAQPLTDDILSATGPQTSRWIGIAPFAQHRGKVYPKDLLQQVIDTLAQEAGTTLFLFGGGKDETRLLKKMANDRPNVIVAAGGKFTLKQELKIISHLNVMLSMDSANAHMAAMQGTPVVTLWGATHPYAGFAPFNQPSTHQLTANREQYPLLPTSIYGNKIVKGYEDAMHTIAPETVVAKLHEVMG
jgi:ADP-heptose:LPS heptosyltransferase